MKKTALAENIGLFEAALYQQGWEELPKRFVSSSKDRNGKDDIIEFISELSAPKG